MLLLIAAGKAALPDQMVPPLLPCLYRGGSRSAFPLHVYSIRKGYGYLRENSLRCSFPAFSKIKPGVGAMSTQSSDKTDFIRADTSRQKLLHHHGGKLVQACGPGQIVEDDNRLFFPLASFCRGGEAMGKSIFCLKAAAVNTTSRSAGISATRISQSAGREICTAMSPYHECCGKRKDFISI